MQRGTFFPSVPYKSRDAGICESGNGGVLREIETVRVPVETGTDHGLQGSYVKDGGDR